MFKKCFANILIYSNLYNVVVLFMLIASNR